MEITLRPVEYYILKVSPDELATIKQALDRCSVARPDNDAPVELCDKATDLWCVVDRSGWGDQ